MQRKCDNTCFNWLFKPFNCDEECYEYNKGNGNGKEIL